MVQLFVAWSPEALRREPDRPGGRPATQLVRIFDSLFCVPAGFRGHHRSYQQVPETLFTGMPPTIAALHGLRGSNSPTGPSCATTMATPPDRPAARISVTAVTRATVRRIVLHLQLPAGHPAPSPLPARVWVRGLCAGSLISHYARGDADAAIHHAKELDSVDLLGLFFCQ